MSAATPSRPVQSDSAQQGSAQERLNQQSSVQQGSNPLRNQAQASPALPKENASKEQAIQEQIARLAYSLWERRGRIDGSPEKDWLEAERQVLTAS